MKTKSPFIISLTIFLFGSLITNNIFAQSGELDYDFGFGGKTTFDMGSNSEKAYVMQLQEDGKIVLAGSIHESPEMSLTVMRFLQNGNPDITFGGSGFVETFIDGGNSVVNAIAIQNDGKIVAAGNYKYSFTYDIVVARYNSDGSLDTEFGDAGIVITNLDTDYDKANAVAILPDGKILVAGCIDGQYGEDFVLIRYNSDGTMDDSFGENGIIITDFEDYYYDIAYEIEILNDGKILVAGVTATAYYERFAMVRYHNNGDIDASFGEEGKVIANVSSQENHLNDIEIQQDGKIVAAGFSYINSSFDDNFSMARFSSNGSLDESFGIDGWSILPETFSSDEIYSIAIQPSGKIIATGYYPDASNKNFILLQYNSDGTLDESLGDEGIVSTDFDERNETAYAIVIQPDKKIVVAGSSMLEDESDENIVLARYMGDFGLNIEEDNSPVTLNINPNPFTNELVINYVNKNSAKITGDIIIYDFLGKEIHKQSLINSITAIDTETFIPGIYFVSVISGNDMQNCVVVKP